MKKYEQRTNELKQYQHDNGGPIADNLGVETLR
jgi:hypothetical protein